MSMRDKIMSELKQAMKAKDADRLGALRLISAAIKDREIAARGTDASTELSDSDLIAILTKMVKQRRESAQAYEEAGRLELAAKEVAEIAVIEDFLPRQMDEDETAAAIDAVITELGAASVRDIGKVMAELKSRHAGQMDFAKAGAQVKARLA